MTATETTRLVWHCGRCRKPCKTQPPSPTACRCPNPVTSLRPTRVTQVHAPPARPVQALTDEEARLRSLARKGRRVRVTFEAEVSEAWLASSSGTRRVQFVVTTPDGRRHVVDPCLPGLHIEAAGEEEPP